MRITVSLNSLNHRFSCESLAAFEKHWNSTFSTFPEVNVSTLTAWNDARFLSNSWILTYRYGDSQMWNRATLNLWWFPKNTGQARFPIYALKMEEFWLSSIINHCIFIQDWRIRSLHRPHFHSWWWYSKKQLCHSPKSIQQILVNLPRIKKTNL